MENKNMNKKSLVLLIILVIILTSLSFLRIYRDQLLLSSLVTKEEPRDNESDNIQEIDNSEKIAKLYNLPDNKMNNKEFVKEISKNEIDKILSILEANEKILAMISFVNAPDYLIEYNNDLNESIGFRIQDEYILVILNHSRVNNIYKVDDVRELLKILDTTLKDNLQFTELDINKTYSPPKIYTNNMKPTTPGSYTWKNEKGDIIETDVIIDFKEMLSSARSVSSLSGPVVFLDRTDKTNLFKLPSSAKITYAIYKDDKIMLEKEAERMIHGSYRLDRPNILGEYIYELTLTFEDMPNIQASYYFRYSM